MFVDAAWLLALTDADLTALGGVGACLATIGLASVAVYQVRQSRKQTDAMQAQVAAIRETAESQVRPVVFPKPYAGWIVGPNSSFELGRRLMALRISFRTRAKAWR